MDGSSFMTLPLIFVGVVIVAMLAVLLVLRGSTRPDRDQHPTWSSPAEQILTERLSRGEISRADFEARRQLLEAHDPTHRPHGPNRARRRPPTGRHA